MTEGHLFPWWICTLCLQQGDPISEVDHLFSWESLIVSSVKEEVKIVKSLALLCIFLFQIIFFSTIVAKEQQWRYSEYFNSRTQRFKVSILKRNKPTSLPLRLFAHQQIYCLMNFLPRDVETKLKDEIATFGVVEKSDSENTPGWFSLNFPSLWKVYGIKISRAPFINGGLFW